MNKIIAVDFDGTLNKVNHFPDLGEPNIDLINILIFFRKNGTKLILNTCRTNNHLDEAVNFCKLYGLEFDAVNENLPEIIEAFGGNDTRKIVASLYIDDLSITPQDFIQLCGALTLEKSEVIQ